MFTWRCTCGYLVWSNTGFHVEHTTFHGQILSHCPVCDSDLDDEFDTNLSDEIRNNLRGWVD